MVRDELRRVAKGAGKDLKTSFFFEKKKDSKVPLLVLIFFFIHLHLKRVPFENFTLRTPDVSLFVDFYNE